MSPADETVRNLLNVLSLLGFSDGDDIAANLQEACKEDSSREFLQVLSDNLKAEDIPSLHRQLSGIAYQPNTSEKAVAEQFASRHLPHAACRPSKQDKTVQESRQATTSVLCNAGKQMEKELTKARRQLKKHERKSQEIDASENRIQRLNRELEGAHEQTVLEVNRLQHSHQLLEQAVHELDAAASNPTLLCLQHIHQYNQIDEEWLSELRSYWAAQISDRPASSDVFTGWMPSELPGNALRLLLGDEDEAASAKALEVDRIRQSYSTVLEGNMRMKALQAKQEATLQALKGGLLRRELASQDAAFLMREKKAQQKMLDGLLQTKQQLLSEDVPRICHSIGSLQCLDIIKAELDIELHRNMFYCGKKKAVTELVEGRAARIAALIMEARHEAQALKLMLDSSKTLAAQVQVVNDAIQIRTAKHEAAEVLSGEPGLTPGALKATDPKSIEEMEAAVDTLVRSLTGGAIPQMLASSGQKAQDQLGQATEMIFQQQESYNSIMRTDAETVNAERDVFHKFFAKPQLLLKDVKTLQQSLKVKAARETSPRKLTARPKRTTPLHPLSRSVH